MISNVLIVGAGVIGLSCAVRLADAGLAVRVVDPEPGRGATYAAAGMLAPATELTYGEVDLLSATVASARRWPSWAATLTERSAGGDVGFSPCGSLMVARDADDAGEQRRRMDAQAAAGLDVGWLTSKEVRAVEPNLAPTVRGGVRADGDHQVDNRALLGTLLRIVDRSPSITLDRRHVVGLTGDDATVTGVTVADLSGHTRLAADTVVIAAGAGTPGLVADGAGPAATLAPLLRAIRPVKGQLLHLRSRTGPLATRNLRGLEVYVVSRPDGRIVVGATVEEQGHDTTVTAGGVLDLLSSAAELLPGIAECELVETIAGLRPGSPDNAPLLGRVSGLDGLVMAVGHYRNGVLLSPWTADVVTELLTGQAVPGQASDTVPVDLAPFDPDRVVVRA